MPLAPCRECEKEVSTQARTCPHCGAPFPTQKEWKGWGFDWKSERTVHGYPLIHVSIGRNAQGRLRVAKGIIAIGQFAIGVVTVAQFGVGILFGFGQFILGLTALAQFAVSALFAVGQIATGYIAIGQFVLGYYGLAQAGFAKFLWSSTASDPEAVEFFHHVARTAQAFLGKHLGGSPLSP
jgi:hypothetical protein